MDDHRQTFVREADEQITDLNNALLTLESDPADQEAMDGIFRTAHTLKGNAAAMGYVDASKLAHALEDLLDGVRGGRIEVSTELMDLLFDGVDQLERMIDQIAEDGESTVDPSETEERIRAAIDGETDLTGDGEADDDGETDDEATPSGFGTSADERPSDDPSSLGDSLPVETSRTDGLDLLLSADAAGAVSGLADADGAVFHVRVTIGESQMKGVDALFVMQAVERSFDDFVTVPDRETIEGGGYDDGFDVFVVGDDADGVAGSLGKPSQVESVDVTDVSAAIGVDDGAAAGATADVGDTDVEADGVDEETNASADGDSEASDSAASSDGTDIDKEADNTDEDTDGTGDTSGRGTESKRDESISSVRVDVTQLDTLYGLVEQLVTSRIKLRREMEEAGLAKSDNLDELDKIASNLQNTVMDMRLIPLKKVVNKFPRLVRDIARDQEKEVAFDIEGEDIELDRTILTEIRDPLMHILRNAVDHGIESPAEREAAGKSREGHVSLTATRERDHVTIEVADDGGGLDEERIREKAVEKGVMTPGELGALEESEVYDLVFHPGFSTNDEITDISGRGVGMDVVRSTVKQLDGTVSIDSGPGEGTTISIRLPVTVAIVKIMFVRVGGTEYGIPVKNIDEISRMNDVRRVNGNEAIEHDGDIYPVVRLGSVLDEPAASTNGSGMLLRIRDERRSVALHCDAVLDQEEVVVKPLEGVLSGIPGLTGTAVLGDGDVVPILDVVTL